MNLSIDNELVQAIADKDLAACKAALMSGANPNAVIGENSDVVEQYSVLQLAVLSNIPEIVEEVLKSGADVSRSTAGHDIYSYSNVLALAAARGSKDVFGKVLDYSSPEVINSACIIYEKNKNKTVLPILHSLAANSYSDYETKNDEVKMLLDKGYDVDKKDTTGRTAAQYAFSARNLTTLKLLADYGADLDAKMENGVKIINGLFNFDGTYFDFSYRGHHVGSIEDGDASKNMSAKNLLKAQKDKDLMELRLKDVLDAYQGKSVIKRDKMVSFEENGININDVLLSAIKKDDIKNIKQALKYGANPFETVKIGNEDGISAMRYTIENRKTDVLDIMIEAGVDMNRSIRGKFNNYSNVLFYYLAEEISDVGSGEKAYLKTFDKLLAATSDESLKEAYSSSFEDDTSSNTENKTRLLTYMVNDGACFIPVFDRLMKRGYDVNILNSDKTTALHTAVENDDLNKVKLLVENGGDLNLLDKNGKKLADVLFNPNDYVETMREIRGAQPILNDIKQIYDKQHKKSLKVKNISKIKDTRGR